MDIGAVKQTAADINEAVIKPAGEELGKAIEEGVNTSLFAPPKPLDPLVQQKKQEEEQKKKTWALRVIDWYKKIQEEQKKVREAKKQTEMVKTKEEEEEKKKKKVEQYKAVEKQKVSQDLGVLQAQRKTEIRGGVGG